MTASLLVRSADRTVALPLDAVAEVVALDTTLPAPGLVPAVRGVTPVRGGLAPLAHLAALIAGSAAPAARGVVGVAVVLGGQQVVFEVDEAIDVLREAPEPLPAGWGGNWATTGVRHAGTLVPVVEIGALVARLTARRAEGVA